jgi:predicted regulator of Ras-like GTPase activity (Roadblock/LC7/MglB family)
MVSDGLPGDGSEIDWLLGDLIGRVPHARSAVLLSADGLPTAAHGLDRDHADQLAAIASNLFSTARAAGLRFGGSDEVRQVVAELEATLLFVSSAGDRSVLAVLAGQEADARVVGYEMAQLVNSVRPFLATPVRVPDTGPQGVAGQR